jgi:hypothetical protein
MLVKYCGAKPARTSGEVHKLARLYGALCKAANFVTVADGADSGFNIWH